jgi:GNAT superfamily N-acetyltransferase
MLQIEKAVPERDYESCALLLNAAEGISITGKTLINDDADSLRVGDFNERYVAFFEGKLVGYGAVYHSASSVAGRFSMTLIIDEAYCKRGFGQAFYDFLLPIAKAAGANMLISECLETSPESLNFAQKQGFFIRSHVFASVLDLESFDGDTWMETVRKSEATGIRFSSLADEGFTEEAQRKLHELNVRLAKDNPSSDGLWNPTFEQFKADIYDSDWFDPKAQLVAMDGERYVGLSAVGFEDDGAAFTTFTGVDRDYRGRGIAQALKSLAACYAKGKGAKSLTTDNDAKNDAMLAVNNKFGYQRQKGTYVLRKLLS